MNNRPTFASLSPTLLARKGAARPAMRPQIQPIRQFHENTVRAHEDDLGWNDMGSDAPQPAAPAEVEVKPTAEIVPLTPAVEQAPPAFPEVVRQQEALAESILPNSTQDFGQDSGQDCAKARRSALAEGRRAAFTLRLDGERHLKLRLACVTSNRSAQQLVTEALDRLIAELPDVAELAAQVSKRR